MHICTYQSMCIVRRISPHSPTPPLPNPPNPPQPHLAPVCARLRRDYPRLAEGMDAALLLELGDDCSPRAPGLADLVQVLVSWQWCVVSFVGGVMVGGWHLTWPKRHTQLTVFSFLNNKGRS